MAVFAVDKFFQQRAADSLRQSAGHLAFDDHRIDFPSDIFGDQIIENLDLTGFLVDLHGGDVHAVRKRPLIGGKKIFFGDTGRYTILKSWARQRQARQVGEIERTFRRAASDDPAIAHDQIGGIDF